jgi:hypothetical protein
MHRQPHFPPGVLLKSPGSQERKVFIGKIPHDMSEETFRQKMLARWPKKIQQVWVQKHKNEQAPSGKVHRGFGFAIYKDRETIDELLGNAASAFVDLSDEIEIEVKRAEQKGSSKLQAEQSPVGVNAGVPLSRPNPGFRTSSESSSPCHMVMPDAAQHFPACSNDAAQAQQAAADLSRSCPTSPSKCVRSCHGIPSAQPQWATGATQVLVVGYMIPPFPVVTPSLGAMPPLSTPPIVQAFPVTASVDAPGVQALPAQPSFDHSSQRLLQMLNQALPDVYED